MFCLFVCFSACGIQENETHIDLVTENFEKDLVAFIGYASENPEERSRGKLPNKWHDNDHMELLTFELYQSIQEMKGYYSEGQIIIIIDETMLSFVNVYSSYYKLPCFSAWRRNDVIITGTTVACLVATSTWGGGAMCLAAGAAATYANNETFEECLEALK